MVPSVFDTFRNRHHRMLMALCALLVFPSLQAQTPQPQKPEEPPMTAGAPQNAAVDAQHRPITAGGTVKTGPIVFENIAQKAGLTGWRNVTGGPEKKLIIEAKGSGVCLIDFDRDGWLDIYFVNGSTFE